MQTVLNLRNDVGQQGEFVLDLAGPALLRGARTGISRPEGENRAARTMHAVELVLEVVGPRAESREPRRELCSAKGSALCLLEGSFLNCWPKASMAPVGETARGERAATPRDVRWEEPQREVHVDHAHLE